MWFSKTEDVEVWGNCFHCLKNKIKIQAVAFNVLWYM